MKKYRRTWNKTRFCGNCGRKLGRWEHLLNWCGLLRCTHTKEQAKKYIVKPGIVADKEGNPYHISALELIHLYGVAAHECYIADTPERIQSIQGLAVGLKWLVPREDGDYSL